MGKSDQEASHDCARLSTPHPVRHARKPPAPFDASFYPLDHQQERPYHWLLGARIRRNCKITPNSPPV